MPFGFGKRPSAPPPPEGLVEAGNIDLLRRPVVKNPDGTISTVRSISIGTDRGEVVIPTVSDDGQLLDNAAAIELYARTGRHLGVFRDVKSADAFARRLHEQQERLYAPTPSRPSR